MSVKPLPQTLNVIPQQGMQGNARRDARRDDQTRSHDEEEDEPTDAQPSVNAFGEVIGKLVNVSA